MAREQISILKELLTAARALNRAQGPLGRLTGDEDARVRAAASRVYDLVEDARRTLERTSKYARPLDNVAEDRAALRERRAPSKRATPQRRRRAR